MEESNLDGLSNNPTNNQLSSPIKVSANELELDLANLQFEGASSINTAFSSLTVTQDRSPHFPFLTLPGEIRNKIYQYTYLTSRDRGEQYNVPDFIVHGDRLPSRRIRGGIRWLNISCFNLFLVCKQILYEALPAVSPLVFFEIKTYHDLSKSVVFTMRALQKASVLYKDARKVTINFGVSKKGFDSDQWNVQATQLGKVLPKLPKLKELEVKVFISHLEPEGVLALEPFFKLARKGVCILVELSDFEPDPFTTAREHRDERARYEKLVFKAARKFGGRNCQVWVEWSTVRDEK